MARSVKILVAVSAVAAALGLLKNPSAFADGLFSNVVATALGVIVAIEVVEGILERRRLQGRLVLDFLLEHTVVQCLLDLGHRLESAIFDGKIPEVSRGEVVSTGAGLILKARYASRVGHWPAEPVPETVPADTIPKSTVEYDADLCRMEAYSGDDWLSRQEDELAPIEITDQLLRHGMLPRVYRADERPAVREKLLEAVRRLRSTRPLKQEIDQCFDEVRIGLTNGLYLQHRKSELTDKLADLELILYEWSGRLASEEEAKNKFKRDPDRYDQEAHRLWEHHKTTSWKTACTFMERTGQTLQYLYDERREAL